jgi:hypothetical protein
MVRVTADVRETMRRRLRGNAIEETRATTLFFIFYFVCFGTADLFSLPDGQTRVVTKRHVELFSLDASQAFVISSYC